MPVTTEKVAMTHLPIHPYTGLHAIGMRRDGRPIWPVRGGDGTTPPPPGNPPVPVPPVNPPVPGAPPAPPAGDPPKPDDEPLGEGGKKALDAERQARKELERQLAELAPLKKLAEALGGGDAGKGQNEVEQLTERLAAQEKAITDEREARWRAEVQADKKLTAAQAARLVGDSKEALIKDADDLLAAFSGSGGEEGEDDKGRRRPGMRPDPAQGARPGDKAASLDAGRSLYAERHKQKTTTT